MRRLFPSLLFFGIFVLMGCSQAPFPLRGSKAPDVSLKPLFQNQSTSLLSSVYNETPVLLVFWASWCPSCVEEVAVLNEWHQKLTPQGLKILGINVQESPEDILNFKARQPIDYPIVLDETGEVANAFGLVGIPASVFLAKGGEILYYGFSLPQNIEQLLKKGETRI